MQRREPKPLQPDPTEAWIFTATLRGTRGDIAYELAEASRAVREGYMHSEGWELEPDEEAQSTA